MLQKTRIYIYISVIGLLFSILFLSCEAPRSNPLDPDNQVNSGLAALEGTIQTLSIPYTPLQGVSVQWLPEKETGSVTVTDAGGSFNFENVNRANGTLVVQKSGFFNDTLKITWGTESRIVKFINMNRLPQLDSIAVFTSVINSASEPAGYELNIIAKINDIDNDIDSVYVQNEFLKLSETLNYDAVNKQFEKSFSSVQLKVENLERIIGQDFGIVVDDKFSHSYKVGTERITRVINEYVQLITPINMSVVDTLPVFSWQKFQAGYMFTYTIEIYTTDFTRELVHRVTNISSNLTTYKITEPLPRGSYDWVVWIVDRFNNRSMSVPGTFTVQ